MTTELAAKAAKLSPDARKVALALRPRTWQSYENLSADTGLNINRVRLACRNLGYRICTPHMRPVYTDGVIVHEFARNVQDEVRAQDPRLPMGEETA